MTKPAWLAVLLIAIPLFNLNAQCPDGTPPPCGRGRAAVAPAPAIDPNRMAILPFRVTTADSLLGEGIAELVATEFSGGSGPRAVHMGTALAAWRRAGGGLRAPLPQPAALRLARAMGAGLLVDGSVVGLGQRLTITASVVRASDGWVRRAPPVNGHQDSLDVLISRVVVGVMAAAGGEVSAEDRGRTTASPAAMRAYLEGLSAYRRGDVGAAAPAFERALAIDSTFALAAFRRLQIAAWQNQPAPIAERWGPLAWSFRSRLSRADRAVLEAVLGPRFPARTPAAEWLAAAEQATREAPESPDAWYQLGDLILHGWSGEPNPIARARTMFERAYAIDSQELVLEHLVESAMLTGDTGSLRRLDLTPIVERNTMLAWYAAAWVNDTRTLNLLRRREATWNGFVFLGGLWGASRAAVDEMIEILVTRRGENRTGFYHALVAQGRPRAATAFILGRPGAGILRDVILVENTAWADGDEAAGQAALARLIARQPTDSMQASYIACTRAQLAVARGLPLDVDDAAVRARPVCALLVAATRAVRAGTEDAERLLLAADSAVREGVFITAAAGYEGPMLSRLWLARGDTRRALAAIRMRVENIGASGGVIGSVIAEGHLALAAGDTAVAIRAFRRYLRMRNDPEPELIPQRDSVVAALARLERARP